MSDFERLPRHPWLDELLADPSLAVADLLAGRADKYPYARLRNAEFLIQVLPEREGLEAEYDALENALLAWIDARRAENWQVRARRGLAAYVGALVEALSAIQMLELKRAARHLDELHNAYLRWLEPLRLGNASDPALELWRCHALLPGDSAHCLADWMRFGVEAGQARPATYLTVALQGLRELPTGNDANANLRYALHALAKRYLTQRGADSNAANELRQYHASVRLAYPRAPQTWREVWEEALAGLKKDDADAVRAEIDGGKHAPAKAKKAAPHLDPSRFPGESRDLAAALGNHKPVATLWPRIEKLFNDTLAYCRESGDSYYFVSSLGWIGDLAWKKSRSPVQTAGEILRWVPEALDWNPSIPQTWMLWAHCLDALDQSERAEWVYWEMRRYFPDDEHCRTELARLLLRQGRDDEALGLLREAAERFPERIASHVELARLLLRRGKDGEAEHWLREAVERHPDNEPSRVELARLLMARGAVHFPEARRRLDEIIERHPHDAQSRVELARLLDLQGDKPGAIAMLEAWQHGHPGNQYAINNLRRLREGHDMGLPRWNMKEDETPAAMPQASGVALPLPSAAAPGEQLAAAARAARAAFRMGCDEAAGRAELQDLLAADPDDQLAAFYLAWRGAAVELPDLPQAYGLQLAGAWRAPEKADWAELAQRFPHRRRLTWALRWLAGLRGGVPLDDTGWQRLEKFAATEDLRPAPGEELVARWVKTAGRDGAKLPGAPEALAEELVALTINRDLSPVASIY